MVIVKAKKGKGHCICVSVPHSQSQMPIEITHACNRPILTYGGRATGKPGVKPEDHAIIYTGDTAPKEVPGEGKLHKKAIRVKTDNAREKLAEASRVNYNKLYTIEHNYKVCFIGKIHPASEGTFFSDFKRKFDESDGEGEDDDAQEPATARRGTLSVEEDI